MSSISKIDSLIPKQLVAWILVLVVLLISSFYLFTYFEKVRTHEIYRVHVPILERTAISLRLNQSLRHTLDRGVITRDKEISHTYLQQLEAFKANQNALFKKYADLSANSVQPKLSREELTSIEQKILALSREGDWQKAHQILASSQYEETFLAYEFNLAQAIEKMSWVRDGYLQRQNSEVRLRLALLIVATLLLAVLMQRLIASYNVNLRARVETEKRLEAERARSIQSEKLASLGEMAGGIAHEINNPLTIIQGNAQLLEDIIGTEQADAQFVRKISERISNTTQRIAKIILSLRKVAKDGSVDEIVSVNMKELVDELLDLCEEKIRAKDIEIRLDIDDIHVKCREVEISQVLINLLNNAYDAVKDQDNSWIRVSCHQQEAMVSITVDDSGEGIPSEVAEKMFNPFFTNKPIGSGTGLGLSVSKTIIESHGGDLSYQKRSDFTRFQVLLPLESTNKKEEAS